MKTQLAILAMLGMCSLSSAAVVQFDLSPAGTDKGVGLRPTNEVGNPVLSTGSGNEILGGITFDTNNRLLSLAIGYGSSSGFTDLTASASAMHIHGPAGPGTNASVVIDLSPLHLPAAIPAQGGVISGGVTLTEPQAADLLAGLYYVNIHTTNYDAGEIRGQLIPLPEPPPNNPPTAECPEAGNLVCKGDGPVEATVTATVRDADGDSLVVVWSLDGIPVQTNDVAGTPPATEASVEFTGGFPGGVTEVTVEVSDGQSDPVSCSTLVTVEDTTPPEIESVVATPADLWPPDHRMVPVTVQVEATDGCGGVTARIVSVESNEPENGNGDGNTAPDWRITGHLTAELRAERSGKGSGRVYTLHIEIADNAGNTVERNVVVRVPHNGGKRVEPTRRVVPGLKPSGPLSPGIRR